jgi:hypothetical protein
MSGENNGESGGDGVPPPPQEWEDERPWEEDPLADFEERRDPLDAQIEEQDKRNKLNFKRAYGLLSVLSMYIIWTVFCIVAVIWLLNYIIPVPFLKPEQLDKLQSIAFSGMLGALATSWARRHIEGRD